MKASSRSRRKPQRRRWLLYFGALVIGILGLSYLYVWERVYTLKLAKEHSMQRCRVTLLAERCHALEFEIAELAAMQRIERIASANFSFSPLRNGQVISYRELNNGDDEPADAIAVAKIGNQVESAIEETSQESDR